VNYTSKQFRLQAAMCLEMASAESDETLKVGWLKSAQHLVALAENNATTLTLGRAVILNAEMVKSDAKPARLPYSSAGEAALSSEA
jgi:hypothetical protein